MSKIVLWALFVLLPMTFDAFCAPEKGKESNAPSEILSLLKKWPQDFNSKNIQGVCDLFAPDLVATYPGTKDRNFSEMCHHLTNALTSSQKRYHYDEPEIEQILVSQELAVVRLIWTLNVYDLAKRENTLIKERGLDVFKRQNDGKWKISISYAYPETEGQK